MSSFVFGSLSRRVACVALGFAALLAAAPARADVVFGNLNAAEDRALSTTNTDLGQAKPDDVNWIAQGFNTGGSALLELQSVKIGLFGASPGTAPLTVSIFGDVSGSPGLTPLFTSGTTQVGATDKYVFSFSGATLQANTTYWVVPNGGSWYWNTGSAQPVGLNGSGYTYVATKESTSTNLTPSNASWDAGTTSKYSVSVSAVPEPSTLALASIGLVAIAGLEIRRRSHRHPRSQA